MADYFLGSSESVDSENQKKQLEQQASANRPREIQPHVMNPPQGSPAPSPVSATTIPNNAMHETNQNGAYEVILNAGPEMSDADILKKATQQAQTPAEPTQADILKLSKKVARNEIFNEAQSVGNLNEEKNQEETDANLQDEFYKESGSYKPMTEEQIEQHTANTRAQAEKDMEVQEAIKALEKKPEIAREKLVKANIKYKEAETELKKAEIEAKKQQTKQQSISNILSDKKATAELLKQERDLKQEDYKYAIETNPSTTDRIVSELQETFVPFTMTPKEKEVTAQVKTEAQQAQNKLESAQSESDKRALEREGAKYNLQSQKLLNAAAKARTNAVKLEQYRNTVGAVLGNGRGLSTLYNPAPSLNTASPYVNTPVLNADAILNGVGGDVVKVAQVQIPSQVPIQVQQVQEVPQIEEPIEERIQRPLYEKIKLPRTSRAYLKRAEEEIREELKKEHKRRRGKVGRPRRPGRPRKIKEKG